MEKITKLQSLNIKLQQRKASGTMNKLQMWFVDNMGNKAKWKEVFSSRVGVTIPTLNSWCSGDRVKKVDDVIKLCEITRLSYLDIIE